VSIRRRLLVNYVHQPNFRFGPSESYTAYRLSTQVGLRFKDVLNDDERNEWNE